MTFVTKRCRELDFPVLAPSNQYPSEPTLIDWAARTITTTGIEKTMVPPTKLSQTRVSFSFWACFK